MSRVCDLLKAKKPMYGHTVSHSNIKTNRRFLPNLQSVVFESKILGKKFQMRCSSSAMRTVLKHGSFDNFLLAARAAHLTDEAVKIRRQMRKAAIKLGMVMPTRALKPKDAKAKAEKATKKPEKTAEAI